MTGPRTLETNEQIRTRKGHFLKHICKPIYIGQFTAMYWYAYKKVDDELGEAARTFFRIASRVTRENKATFRRRELEIELSISRSTLERHMTKILAAQLIEPDASDADLQKGIRNWRVLPFVCWTGEATDMREYLKHLPASHPWWEYLETEYRDKLVSTTPEELTL